MNASSKKAKKRKEKQLFKWTPSTQYCLPMFRSGLHLYTKCIWIARIGNIIIFMSLFVHSIQIQIHQNEKKAKHVLKTINWCVVNYIISAFRKHSTTTTTTGHLPFVNQSKISTIEYLIDLSQTKKTFRFSFISILFISFHCFANIRNVFEIEIETWFIFNSLWLFHWSCFRFLYENEWFISTKMNTTNRFDFRFGRLFKVEIRFFLFKSDRKNQRKKKKKKKKRKEKWRSWYRKMKM